MNAFHIKIRTVSLMVLVAALTGSVGCAKMTWKPSKIFSLDSTWPFRDKDKPREGTPNRMVCTWTDTVMSQPGKPSQRGFGGRVLFYEAEEKNPIIVDGQLVVYAFDETDREPTDNKPTRRYVFPPEQVPLHMSKNEIGASYSFFLPWDEAGGPRTDVSLICRFEPKGGAVISSEQTRQVLPGKLVLNGKKEPLKVPEGVPSKPALPTLQSVQAKRNEARTTQLASYETPAAGSPAEAIAGNVVQGAYEIPERRMSATTINLPGNYQIPTAAQLMNAPQVGADGGQAMAPAIQLPAAAPVAQATLSAFQNVPSVQPPSMAPAPALNRTLPGMQPGTSAAAFGAQPPGQLPMNAAPATTPAAATMMPTRMGFSASPAIQSPWTQQQAQLTAQQLAAQQAMQQQFLQQQQSMQQRLTQPPMPVQTATPQVTIPQQVPLQASGGASVSYPAGQTYLR